MILSSIKYKTLINVNLGGGDSISYGVKHEGSPQKLNITIQFKIDAGNTSSLAKALLGSP